MSAGNCEPQARVAKVVQQLSTLHAKFFSAVILMLAQAIFACGNVHAQVDEQGGDRTNNAGEETSVTQESPTEGGDADNNGTPAGEEENTSPYDYRSSEEISEDRSVSFPVDI